MNIFITLLTILAMVLVVYHHLGYPFILSHFANRRCKKKLQVEQHIKQKSNQRSYQSHVLDNSLPNITLIMPAYNEQAMVAEKIRNLACLDYPADKLAILIACDGCTDQTANIAKAAAEEIYASHINIKIIDFKENRGKVAVLNDLIPQVTTDLVALSDVSALLSIDALLEAAEQFKQADIGVVTGLYQMLTPGSEGETKYWNYQSQVKQNEASLGATIGVHGAFYIFRSELFTPLKEDTINDDFILPMSIVSKGYRAEFVNNIHALELETMALAGDHKRRRRIAAGNMQQLWRLKSLLNPKYKGVAFNFASGKGLRTIMPFLLIISFIGCGLLSNSSIVFLLAFIPQIVLYFVGVSVLVFKPTHCPKILLVIAYIISGYSAGFIGAIRYLCGLERGRWKRIEQ